MRWDNSIQTTLFSAEWNYRDDDSNDYYDEDHYDKISYDY